MFTDSGKSIKRVISFMAVIFLIIIGIFAFMDFDIKTNNFALIQHLIDVFEYLIILLLGFSTAEKFKK